MKRNQDIEMSKAVDMVLALRKDIGKDKAEWCECSLLNAKCRSCEHTETLQAELTDIAQKLQDIDDAEMDVRDIERNRADEALYDLKADLDSERYSNDCQCRVHN